MAQSSEPKKADGGREWAVEIERLIDLGRQPVSWSRSTRAYHCLTSWICTSAIFARSDDRSEYQNGLSWRP